MRAAYRSQAQVIDTLTGAIMRLRTGATRYNTDLRAKLTGSADPAESVVRTPLASWPSWPTSALGVDVHAPAVARAVLVSSLRNRVPAAVLDPAQLLTSELVTNSVLHCGAWPYDALVFRVQLSSTMVRLEVEDPGRGGVIAPRPPDLDRGTGCGLNLVDTLRASWGAERSCRHPRGPNSRSKAANPGEALPAL